MPLFARKRASSQPPLPRGPPPSSSAAIAASAAFLNKSPSAASLSSSAAAAALRSQTSSPEPVGSIQTKRMMRRGSQSSDIRNAMQRTTSNSSMTDRTFRSPSPGGSRRAVSPAPDAPPVPAIPQNVIRSQRRAASLDVPSRISLPSPSTPRSAQRNTSVDRAGRKLNLPTKPDLNREDSSGVNFSRPMSPARAISPPPRPNSSVGWFTSPKVSNGTPRANPSPARPQSAMEFSSPTARKIQQDVQNAASAPVKKNKKTVTEGARLANGTMNTAPTGSVMRTAPPEPVQYKVAPSQPVQAPIQAQTTPKKKKKTTVVSPVDTQASAGSSLAPVNPSPSADASNSPSTPRPTGLHKQPSMVREDPEAEATAEVQTKSKPKSTPVKHSLLRSLRDTDVGTVATSEGPVKAYVAPGGTRPRAASLDVPRSNGRAGSSSPSRNVHAHFVEGSSLATPLSVRHQPPPRSVSPMKSALRQSPASSVRNISPNIAVNGGPRAPPSETSDTTSLASQDGIKPAKVKKSVRISEDGSIPVSPAVDPNARRELSGSYDINEIMKPRSALPSFSSVRGRKLEQAEKPEKVTETVSSSMTNSASTLPDQREASNDQLIGAVLAQHYAQKDRKFDTQTPTTIEPLPPQVTSKETSADVSDSAYSEDETEPQVQQPSQARTILASDETVSSTYEPKTSEHNTEAPEANPIEAAVPSLSLQPPTPGVEEGSEPPLDAAVAQRPALKQRNSMPGSWDGEMWEEQKPAGLSRQAIRDAALLSETDSSDDETAVLQPAQIEVDGHSPVLHPIYESDSGSEVSDDFADAEEELDHPGGFASLDAIVESPVTKPAAVIPSPPISPQVALPPSRATVSSSSALSDEQADNTDWNSATAYWSSLSRKKKLELEAEAEAAIAVPVVESAPKTKKKKQPVDQLDITNPTTFAPAPISPRDDPFESEPQQESRAPALRSSMRNSGESERTSSEGQMRKSMRGPPAPIASSNETHMRTSMRAGGSMRSEGSMRTSMRGDAGAKPSSKRSSAPTTISIPGAGSAAAAAARSQPAQQATKPVIAPLPAYDSDSESSFKKNKRRGSVSTVDSVGKYTMKRSMRSGSVDAGPPAPAERGRPVSSPAKSGSGRFSLRSLSPTGSFLGRNQGEKIRQSLRGAPVDDTPTMRGKNNRASRDAKASSGFGMSGFGKAKAAPAPAPKARSGGFKSRFADSDDEDDAPRGAYRSRFADSDEEDSPIGPPKHMPANLAPVRGIPKRRGQDSDSTDLSDSEDETRAGKRKSNGRASNKPGVPSQSDIDAAMEAARRNVAAMNGGREPGVPQAPPVPASDPVVSGPEVPMTPTRRKGFLGSVLRRNSSSIIPSSPVDSQHPRSPTTLRSPKQPKLQRRTTPQNWPLPAVPTNGDTTNEPRPTTSDGVPSMKRTMRPENRRSMSGNDLNNMANGGTMESDRPGKKKKFSGLRKLFGLHD